MRIVHKQLWLCSIVTMYDRHHHPAKSFLSGCVKVSEDLLTQVKARHLVVSGRTRDASGSQPRFIVDVSSHIQILVGTGNPFFWKKWARWIRSPELKMSWGCHHFKVSNVLRFDVFFFLELTWSGIWQSDLGSGPQSMWRYMALGSTFLTHSHYGQYWKSCQN